MRVQRDPVEGDRDPGPGGSGARRRRPSDAALTPAPAPPRPRCDPFGGPSGPCWNSGSSNMRASSVCSPASSYERHGHAPARHALLHPLDHRLDHLHPPIALVLRRDHVPRRQRAVRQPEHVGHRGVVLGPLLPVAPVLRRELPRLEGVVTATLEAASCSSCDMCIQSLMTIIPSSAKRVLEVVDLLVGPAPLDLGRQALDPLHQDAAVPAAVEDGHAAPSGQRRPEAPQEVVAQLVGRRCGEGGDVHVAGVERLDQPLDRTAFARGVPALEDDAHRRSELAFVQLAAVDQPQVQQAALRLRRDACSPRPWRAGGRGRSPRAVDSPSRAPPVLRAIPRRLRGVRSVVLWEPSSWWPAPWPA